MMNFVKTVSSVVAAVLLAGMLSSCGVDSLAPVEADGLVFHLAVSGQTPVLTKATRPGEDLYHENTMGNVADFFFFRTSAKDAVLQHSVRAEVQTGGDVTIPISRTEMLKIFGNLGSGSSCSVMVVTNYDGPYPTGENLTRSDIEGQVLAPANWLSLPQEKFVMICQDETLILRDASNPHPLRNGNDDPVINLERVAVKLTFEISVKESVSDGTNSWTPVTTGITAYLVNAMRKAELGGDPMPLPPDPKSSEGQEQLYTYDGRALMALTTSTDDLVVNTNAENRPLYAIVRTTTENGVKVPVRDTDGVMVQEPFYAYPSSWDTGSVSEPYIKLVIPWNTGKRIKQFYYKIPFAQRELTRNTWYKVVIDVQALGGEEDYAPTLNAQYYVAPWSGSVNTGESTDASTLPTSIIAARYLSVPTKEFILYNIDEFTVPINSSHDVEIVGFQVGATGIYTDAHKSVNTNYVGEDPRIYNPFAAFSEANSGKVYAVRPDYSAATPKAYSPVAELKVVDNNYAADDWNIKILSKKEIKFRHTLSRDMSQAGYDVAPYTVRFRIRHADAKTQYYEDVTIEQRPPIIIVPSRNSDTGPILSETNRRGKNHTAEDGYVFNNGTRSNTDMSTGRSNNNFNMYIIETSVLPTSGVLANFKLGDPRSLTPVARPGDADNTYFASAQPIDGTANRRLANYYPSGDDSYDDFIAPSFRIASSFGASPAMSRNDAIRRCAAYQEDGYPAGRWRLPTVAEITFMAQLTTDNLIPRLLGSDDETGQSYYWSNSGAVGVYNGGNQTINPPEKDPNRTTNSYVRCVYDEWYWGQSKYAKADRTQFRWGDQLRENVTLKEN